MEQDYLETVEVAPEGEAKSAVIWLHGLGADGHDFQPIVPLLGVEPALGVRFVFPHASPRPVTINYGMVMRAWYDILSMSLPREVDQKGVDKSAEQVRALIRRENERGIATDRIVMAGFSQGGAIAYNVALRYPEKLAGLIALSTYLVDGDELEAERSEVNHEIPIFHAHGERDPMVPPALGDTARDRLLAMGYSVDSRSYDMAHEVCPEEIRAVGNALNKMLSA